MTNTTTASKPKQTAEERPNITISELLKTNGALFNIATEDRTENGPIMSGSIEVSKDLNIPVSAFLKKTSKDPLKAVKKDAVDEYLSLSLGGEGKTHYYGKLFRKKADAKLSAPDYSGFITVLPCLGGTDEHEAEDWENAPQLRIIASRERSMAGQAYISLQITPSIVPADEVNF